MRYRLSAFVVFSAFFLNTVPSFAQHGGFGGHGGGGFSGHSMGHFGGRSSGRASGSHSGGMAPRSGHGQQPPMAGAAMVHGRIVQLPTPGFHVLQPSRFRHPVTEFGFRNRSGFFGFGAFSTLGLCSPFGGFPNRFFWGGGFDCFDDDFFFDPFFFGGFFPGAFGVNDVDDLAQPPDVENIDASFSNADDATGYTNYETTVISEQPAQESKSTKPKPTILLQLTDGSMYGLTDYWVVEDRLRYLTDYGGENSIPLSRIDFDKTNQLNAERGVKFYVLPESGKH